MRYLIRILIILLLPTLVNAQTRNIGFYLEQAMANSPLIHNSDNEQQLIQLDLKQINSILSKPEINVESNILFAPIISHDNGANRFQWVSNGADKYTGYDMAATDGGQYQALVTLQQPLLSKSKLVPYQKKAVLNGQINSNQVKLTEHELKQLVSYQYLLCLKAKKQTENSQSVLETMRNEVTTMQQLVDQSIYQQTDLMLLNIEYKNYEIGLKNFQSDYAGSIYDLNLLCGINDTTIFDLKELNLALNNPVNAVSNFSTSFLLDSLNIAADLKINDLKYQPQLNWFANAGLNAVYLPTPNRMGFSTGLSFSWNVFDGHQRKIQQERSLLRMNSLAFEKKNLLTKVDIQKNKALQQINSVNQRIELINQQLEEYNQVLSAYSLKLEQGELSVIEFKNLFQDISAKKQELIDLTIEKQLLINAYNYWNY